MSKTPLPLVVEPAVAADAPVLGAMQADAFHSAFFHDIFIAPYTTGAWAGFIQRATAAAVQSPPPPPHASPRTIIGVIREGGLAKAACVVHVAPDKHAVMELYGPYRESWGEPLPSMNADKMDAFFSGMTTQHQSTMGDTPHIHCEVIMTHPTAQRRGYGLALLEFVNAIADERGLPLYLDAGEDVTGLYERVGYVVQPGRVSDKMLPMVRSATKT